jgi:hypothetical protein
MKRLFVLVAVCLLTAAITGSATAQTRIIINPQAGVNSTLFSNDVVDDQGITFGEFKSRVGFQLGGYVRIGQRWYLQPGAFYHNIGLKLTATEAADFDSFDSQIHTLLVPVLVGFDIIESEFLVFRANAGGGANVRLSVDENDQITKDDVKSLSWSALFGLGLDISFITADLGYQLGLSSFFETEDGGTDSKLRSWYGNVGIKIPVGP